MKSVIEGLFAGLLENGSFSEKSKKNNSENKDSFSSDINEVLFSINQNKSDLDEKENKGKIKKIENSVIINKFDNIKETKSDEIKLEHHINGSGKIKELLKNEKILGPLANKTKNNNNIIYKKTETKIDDFILNNQKKAKKVNNAFSFKENRFGNKTINLIEKKPTNSYSIISQTKEKKIKTFFKNYLNFSNLKSAVKNKKVIKIITSNSLNTIDKEASLLTKKNKALPNLNFKEKNTNSYIEKDNGIFNAKNINENINLENSSNEKSFNQSRFSDSLLRNILDLKSNNINQRLAEIFERNIKLGNNKFEIQIKPENLGKVEVFMEINGDNIDITFKVENNNVASLLSENNVNLQKSLSSQGLNLSNLNLNYNNQNKFGEDNSRKEKKDNFNKNNKEEESLDLKIEKHYKNNNLVYIKA